MTKAGLVAAACAALAAAAAGQAVAHHSTAMYDSDTTVTLTGTVREFRLLNPHSWLVLEVAPAGGAPTNWKFETSGPYALARIGLRSGVISPGDAATVVMNPMKNGTAVGNLKSVSVRGKEYRIGGGG